MVGCYGGIGGSCALEELAALGHLDQAAGVVLAAVLEGGEHIAVTEPQVGVRMVESAHLTEAGQDARVQRLIQIEQPALAGVKSVGKQVVVGRHDVFGVVWMRSHGSGGNARDDVPVGLRARIRVDHAEKVASRMVSISRPDEEIGMFRLRKSAGHCHAQKGENRKRHPGTRGRGRISLQPTYPVPVRSRP